MAKKSKKDASEPIADIIRQLAAEKGISESEVKTTISKMIIAAYQKSFGKQYENCIVEFEDDLSAYHVYAEKRDVTDIYIQNDFTNINKANEKVVEYVTELIKKTKNDA